MKQPIIKIFTRCTLHAARFFTRYTLYATRFFIIIAAAILCTKSLTIAVDPPHSSARGVQCNSCHSVHKASGPSLTNDASNANLCFSCHVDPGPASNKPFNELLDQAVPGTTGISHRWDKSVANGAPLWNGTITLGNPNNPGGLRPAAANYLIPVPDEIQSLALNMQLRKFGNVVTCSVCHNQHGQANTPWDPYGGTYTGMQGGDSGITSSPDNTVPYDTIIDSSKSWTASWIGNYVKMTSGGNIGQIRQILSNTAISLTVSPGFPAAIAANEGYEIIGRHFQRRSANLNAGVDAVNDMCEDCHYYRKAGTTGTNVKDGSWDGNKKSHPIVKIFSNAQGETRNVSDSTQFNDAPLEPDYVGWVAQTGARYHINGGSDNNVTNNIVVDSSKKTRCLSCHGIHYTDSSAGTIDGP